MLHTIYLIQEEQNVYATHISKKKKTIFMGKSSLDCIFAINLILFILKL